MGLDDKTLAKSKNVNNQKSQDKRYHEILNHRASFYDAVEKGRYISQDKLNERITF